MVLVNNKKIEHFTAIYHMALGLERWFPANNGPFAYGTRLCEEIGELTEALYAFEPLNEHSKKHLIKEIEDVLQIVMGVLGIYRQTDHISGDISSYFSISINSTSKDAIIELVIRAGQFADAINHMESQGIKQQKHGKMSEKRLVEKASVLVACISQFVQRYELLDKLEQQIQNDYLHLSSRGLIDL